MARPAVAREAAPGRIGGRRVGEDRRSGVLQNPFPQRLERFVVAARRTEPRVVVAQRDEASARPAQVFGAEVVVREPDFAERLPQFVERIEQPLSRFRAQRLVEAPPCGQVLEHQRRALRRSRGVLPEKLPGQRPVLREAVRVDPPQLRGRALHRVQRRGREGQKQQPPFAAPGDFGLGETRRAHQAGQSVGTGRGAGVGERPEREVGRQQRPGEGLQGRCHGYSVLTLMDPMLSMATSSSAEAL